MTSMASKLVEPRKQPQWQVLRVAMVLGACALVAAACLGIPWLFGPGNAGSDPLSQPISQPTHPIRF